MKKSLIISLAFIFTFVSCISLNGALSRITAVNSVSHSVRNCIVIDAGHGGKDSGTVAPDGTPEKDINLAIALDLYDFLRFYGISSKLIRNSDEECYPSGSDRNRSDLYNRLDFVNKIDNSILVSIHQNHFEDTSQWGMQVWYTVNEETSKLLADNILNISNEFLQKNNSRVNKPSDNSYYILYKATSPSVMVECGFMSNYDENEKLKSSEYQNALAYTISLGINKYLAEG